MKFEGIRNIRDFGNMENSSGLFVRPGKIMRSSDLSMITDNDIKRLTDEYKLATVIDLRTEEERKQKPDILIAGAEYIHIPIFEERAIGITRESGHKFEADSIPEMSGLYENMVKDEYSVSRIGKVIEIIINSRYQPVLFHCTAGKDRTGVISMLLLSMLDVPLTTIFEDYLYTNHTARMEAQAYYDMVYGKTGNKVFAESIRNVFLAKKEYLQSAIDGINGNYGGIQNFISEKLNITTRQINAFKAEMLA